MEIKGIYLQKQIKKKRKCKEIEFNYNIIMRKKLFFIIFLIIFKLRLSKDNINNFYNLIKFTNLKKQKVKYSTNSILNKGFLEINTTHKGKFTYYDYTSNIKIYKDLYKDISYIPITNSNFVLQSNQISKKKFSKLCEKGILLDKVKYKRNKNPRISVIIPYYIISKNLTITMTLRSIQNQSLKDFEIIIVDDGSLEEKIIEVLNEMKNDNRIILLRHKERKGTLLTRVDGIRYSSGSYIIQIDLRFDLF